MSGSACLCYPQPGMNVVSLASAVILPSRRARYACPTSTNRRVSTSAVNSPLVIPIRLIEDALAQMWGCNRQRLQQRVDGRTHERFTLQGGDRFLQPFRNAAHEETTRRQQPLISNPRVQRTGLNRVFDMQGEESEPQFRGRCRSSRSRAKDRPHPRTSSPPVCPLFRRTTKLTCPAWTPRTYIQAGKRTTRSKLGRVRCSDWFGTPPGQI